MRFSALLTAAMLCSALIAAHPPPAAANEIARFVESFDSPEWASAWDGYLPGIRDHATIVPGGRLGSALRVTIEPNHHYGAGFRYIFEKHGWAPPDEVYFRYYLKLESGWGGAGTGKLPGFGGVYSHTAKGGFPSTSSAPGWSARLSFSGPTAAGTPIGYYAYHLDQAGQFGETLPWGTLGTLRTGEWYCMEGRVLMNTPGQRDGVLQGWVDGQAAVSQTEIAFRRDGEDVAVRSFWFNVYYGGKNTTPVARSALFDELELGTERIGCLETPAGMTASGDISGDGHGDLVLMEPCGDRTCLAVRLGSETGLEEEATRSAALWTSGETPRHGLHVVDVDGDEMSDVVYRGRCEPDGRDCWLVHRGGEGGLTGGTDWGGAAGPAVTEAIADVDGDGFVDIVSSATCAGESCWMMQPGGPDGPSAAQPWGSAPGSVDPVAGDFDGDGSADLAYAVSGDGAGLWLVQRSTGTGFGEPETWGLETGGLPTMLVAGDLDGDGKDDLLYRTGCRSTSTCWRLARSTGTSFATQPWSAAGLSEATAVLPAQLDGDGRLDVLARTACAGRECWVAQHNARTGFTSIDSGADDETPIHRPPTAAPLGLAAPATLGPFVV